MCESLFGSVGMSCLCNQDHIIFVGEKIVTVVPYSVCVKTCSFLINLRLSCTYCLCLLLLCNLFALGRHKLELLSNSIPKFSSILFHCCFTNVMSWARDSGHWTWMEQCASWIKPTGRLYSGSIETTATINGLAPLNHHKSPNFPLSCCRYRSPRSSFEIICNFNKIYGANIYEVGHLKRCLARLLFGGKNTPFIV